MKRFNQPFYVTIPGFYLSIVLINDLELVLSLPREILSEFEEPFFFLFNFKSSKVELEKLLDDEITGGSSITIMILYISFSSLRVTLAFMPSYI
jgi:hypothetical protein